MVLRRMGPHPEDHVPKTDLQIVEEVLHEQSSSSTFLSSISLTSSSKRSSASSARIRELEEKLANEKQQSLDANEMYQQEMEERMIAQEEKYEALRIKQEEELASINKEQDEKALAFEKRHQEMYAILSLHLRTQGRVPPS